MTSLLLTVAFVVIISAACSLAEAVLYSVPATHIAKLEEEGKRSGKQLAALRDRVDRPITAILTINTVANTAGAAVAGSLAASALGEGNVVLFSAALTVAILLFSEILPKTIGVVYARSVAPLLAMPLTATVWVMRPVIALIGLLTKAISSGQEEGISHEEIASLARMGSRSGALDSSEAAVIENILGLSEKNARSIMTPRPVVFALQQDTTVTAALADDRLMVHSRIPVYNDGTDDIVGMVFRRDVLACAELDAPISTLIRAVEFVGGLEPVNRTLELMLAHKLHMLVVVDEFGGFGGVVSLEDVLEEILGEEIVDEFDQVADLRELATSRRTAAVARMKREKSG